jgi:hypothetical protein
MSFLLAIIMTGIGSAARGQTVLFTARGEVSSISDPDHRLPSSIAVGDAIFAEGSYRAETASGGPFSDNRARYLFPSGALTISYRIDASTWMCTNELSGSVGVDNDVPVKLIDEVRLDVVDTARVFPYALPDGSGNLSMRFRDSQRPLGLLHGLALPTIADDVDFSEANEPRGEIYCYGTNGSFWSIQVTFTDMMLSSTVAVEETTWSAVKHLYD